jgi:hypothetical protein
MIEKIKPRRVKRLWIPAATLAGSAGGVAALAYSDSLDPAQQFQLLRGLILGTPLLLIVWLIFLSGLRWWQRFAYLLIGSVVAAEPIEDRRQVQEAIRQRDVGDVRTPHLVGPLDTHVPQQIRVNPMPSAANA